MTAHTVFLSARMYICMHGYYYSTYCPDKRFLVFHIRKEGQSAPLMPFPPNITQCFPLFYKNLSHMSLETEITSVIHYKQINVLCDTCQSKFCRCFCIASLMNVHSYSSTKPAYHNLPQISTIIISLPAVNSEALTQNPMEQKCQLLRPTPIYDFLKNQICYLPSSSNSFSFYPTYHLQQSLSPVRP